MVTRQNVAPFDAVKEKQFIFTELMKFIFNDCVFILYFRLKGRSV